jgi:ATP-dependent exoDNAse (exonuclease V) beta subunit
LRYSNLSDFDELIYDNHEHIDYQLRLDNLYKSLLGTLIHRYLEFGIFAPGKNKICSELIQIGIPQNKISESIEFITTMLNNTRQDSIFDWLFKPRESTLVEAEFVTNGNSIVIDRLFIEDNILWIIDYKTAQLVDGESISQFVLRQQKQHTKQLLLYKMVMEEVYNKQTKCALYCPAVQQLIEV